MTAKANQSLWLMLAAGGAAAYWAVKSGKLTLGAPATVAPTVNTPVYNTPTLTPQPIIIQTAPAVNPGAITTSDGTKIIPTSAANPCTAGMSPDVCACINVKGSDGWNAATCQNRISLIQQKYTNAQGALSTATTATVAAMGASTILQNARDSLGTILNVYGNQTTDSEKISYSGLLNAVNSVPVSALADPNVALAIYRNYLLTEMENAVLEYRKITGGMALVNGISLPSQIYAIPSPVAASTATTTSTQNVIQTGSQINPPAATANDVAKVKAAFTAFNDPTAAAASRSDDYAALLINQYRAGQLDPNSGTYKALVAAGV